MSLIAAFVEQASTESVQATDVTWLAGAHASWTWKWTLREEQRNWLTRWKNLGCVEFIFIKELKCTFIHVAFSNCELFLANSSTILFWKKAVTFFFFQFVLLLILTWCNRNLSEYYCTRCTFNSELEITVGQRTLSDQNFENV